MSQRAVILRNQAAEFRRLADTFNRAEMRDRLSDLANHCEQIAAEIEHSIASGRELPQNSN